VPACSLMQYYKERRVVKFFVVVTDEIENEKFDGYYFPTLFQKYHREVYPAKIVFVSFLENPNIKGRMVSALEEMGIIPLQFKLDGNRPDLQKLDSLLGLLATESSFFVSQIKTMAEEIEKHGFKHAIGKKDVIPFPEVATTTTSSAPSPASSEVEKFVSEERIASEIRAEGKGKGKEKAEDRGVCVVCDDARAEFCLLDCGHLCLCERCVPGVVANNKCPLCVQPIVRAQKIFQA